ncbi:unnamed protein product [Pieris macdunnoughi]|uniref:Uncharacterized protein n=1 Tax=Pieris macdunnoughi TaxID=345717 RepID=A0A821PJ80_9NEOP|nr:unnamed protein product [Pieris macdunnoughi]
MKFIVRCDKEFNTVLLYLQINAQLHMVLYRSGVDHVIESKDLPSNSVSSSKAVTRESVQHVFVLSMDIRTEAQSGECGRCSADCAATRPFASRSEAVRPPVPVAAPPPPSSHLDKKKED